MGEVYLAEDERLGREVALKVLPSSALDDPARRRAFQREARVVSSLSHPAIITIYDLGADGETDYMVTEFVDGRTLRELMDSGPPLSVLDAVHVAVAVTEALAAAHEVGVIHRDIKPENIMVRDDGYVKVLDFGVARLLRRRGEGSEAGVMYGTLPYTAPELIVGAKADARSDLFSLGVVLYELLAGEVPFERDAAAGAEKVSIPPLRRVNRSVPEELERIVMRLLRKERTERFQSAGELLGALEGVRRELEAARVRRVTRTLPVLSFRSPPEESVGLSIPRGMRRIGAGLLLIATLLAAGAWIIAQRGETRSYERVAVLPFEADEEWLAIADGMTDSLIQELSRLPHLRVIARSSAYRYRDSSLDPRRVGRALGADAVVTGSIETAGDGVQVRTELIDVTAGHRIWGETYRRPTRSLLALEQQMVAQIAEELRTAITDARQVSASPEAHRLYLEGRHHWNERTREGFTKAIASFEKAIALDPSFALAHAGLADAHNLLGTYADRPPSDTFPVAKAAALRALELDPTLAEAHTSLAYALQNYDWNWDAAEKEYRAALELSPSYAVAHHWYGGFLMLLGRFDEAIEHRIAASRLDPLSTPIQAAVGSPYFLARRYDRAVEIYRKAIAMDPAYARGHLALGWALLLQGRLEEGIRAIDRAHELSNRSFETLGFRAYAYAKAGRREEAERILRILRAEARENYIDPYEFARIEIALGHPERALTDLEHAYGIRSNLMLNLKVDPSLDPVRADPRFQELLRKMNFPESR